jgi:hypothetical protein
VIDFIQSGVLVLLVGMTILNTWTIGQNTKAIGYNTQSIRNLTPRRKP